MTDGLFFFIGLFGILAAAATVLIWIIIEAVRGAR